MRIWHGVAWLAAAVAWGSLGCTRPNSSPAPLTNAEPVLVTNYYHLNHAQPKLPTIKLWVGTQELEAEVALELTEIATGMMFRTNLAENAGMLFVFARPGPRGFYMKNCVVPLSAAYIDAEGVIDEIVDLHPGVIKDVPSRSDQIKYVLEVNQGWFTRHDVTTGMVINTSSGLLKSMTGKFN